MGIDDKKADRQDTCSTRMNTDHMDTDPIDTDRMDTDQDNDDNLSNVGKPQNGPTNNSQQNPDGLSYLGCVSSSSSSRYSKIDDEPGHSNLDDEPGHSPVNDNQAVNQDALNLKSFGKKATPEEIQDCNNQKIDENPPQPPSTNISVKVPTASETDSVIVIPTPEISISKIATDEEIQENRKKINECCKKTAKGLKKLQFKEVENLNVDKQALEEKIKSLEQTIDTLKRKIKETEKKAENYLNKNNELIKSQDEVMGYKRQYEGYKKKYEKWKKLFVELHDSVGTMNATTIGQKINLSK